MTTPNEERERLSRAFLRRIDTRRVPRTVFARTKPPPCSMRPDRRGIEGFLRELSERFGRYFDGVDADAYVRELRYGESEEDEPDAA